MKNQTNTQNTIIGDVLVTIECSALLPSQLHQSPLIQNCKPIIVSQEKVNSTKSKQIPNSFYLSHVDLW